MIGYSFSFSSQKPNQALAGPREARAWAEKQMIYMKKI